MNKTTKGISLAFTMFALVGMMSFAPISASEGDEGCTPGFWKANAKKGASAWPDNSSFVITPSTLLTVYVDNDGSFDISGVTFLEALNYHGGPGLEGAERILLRAGAAAMLNAAHDESDLDYHYSFDGSNPDTVLKHINSAFGSGDRSEILAVASAFDDRNNAPDGCPFNNSGRP